MSDKKIKSKHIKEGSVQSDIYNKTVEGMKNRSSRRSGDYESVSKGQIQSGNITVNIDGKERTFDAPTIDFKIDD